MTHAELFKLYQLKGRLKGRATCLESDIRATSDLVPRLETAPFQAHWSGRLKVLEDWQKDNDRLLEDVERIIKEAENG